MPAKQGWLHGCHTGPHIQEGLMIGFTLWGRHVESLNNFCTKTSRNSSTALATISAWPGTDTGVHASGGHSVTMQIQDSAPGAVQMPLQRRLDAVSRP